MAKSFKITTSTKHQIRSISLPSRLHPTTTKVRLELNKFKTCEALYVPTEASICNGLTRLIELYKRVNDVLNMSVTQQSFSRHRGEKWVEELLDGSVKLLDACGLARDMVGQIKEHVRDLQCDFRKRKGYSNMESSVSEYISFRKNINKEVKRLIADLKKMDNAKGGCPVLDDQDQHLVMVIKLLTEVSEMTISVFESLFFLLYTKPNYSYRWSMVSKLMQKGRLSCEEEQGNVAELERLDIALLNLSKDGSSIEVGKMQVAQKRLEALETHIEGMDSRLYCIIRSLIRTRSLLLNIVSH